MTKVTGLSTHTPNYQSDAVAMKQIARNAFAHNAIAFESVAKLEMERKACVAMPLCLAGVAAQEVKHRATQSCLELQLPFQCFAEMKGRHAYNCARGTIANGSVNQLYYI